MGTFTIGVSEIFENRNHPNIRDSDFGVGVFGEGEEEVLHKLEILQGDLRGEHTRLYHLAERGQGKHQYHNHYHRICSASKIV